MRVLVALGTFALLSTAPTVAGAASAALPMDSFNDAFYTCDKGAAFAMSYDSDNPTSATMTTSNDNARHELKRTKVAQGVEFAGGPVKFWTDGKTVVVDGTQVALRDCKLKAH